MTEVVISPHVAMRIAEDIGKRWDQDIDVELVELVIERRISRHSLRVSNRLFDAIATEALEYGIEVRR